MKVTASYCGRQPELHRWMRVGALVCLGSAGVLATIQLVAAVSDTLQGHVTRLAEQNVSWIVGLLFALLGGFLLEVRTETPDTQASPDPTCEN